jgi:hypothetical protein
MSARVFDASSVDELKNPNNLYVVDSGKAEESKDPIFVPAVCVYVCSPDTRHFSEWSKHLQRGGRFNIPMWSLEALEAASFHLGVPSATLRERALVVGPIPRRVCNTAAYNSYKLKIDNAMNSEQTKIAGVLLHGAGDIEADHHKDKPLSSIFALNVLPGTNFQEFEVGFVSAYARKMIGMSAFKSLYNSIASNMDPRRNIEYGLIFEEMVFKFVEIRGGLKCIDLQGQAHPTKVQKGGKMVEAGIGMRDRMYKMMKALPMLEEGRSKPVFVGNNFPVIDFADARNRGFSITASHHKKINGKAVENLRVELELKKGTLLHFVVVVPEGYPYPTMPSIVDVKWYKCAILSPLAHPKEWEKVFASEKKTTREPAPTPVHTNAPRRSFSTLTRSVRVVPVTRSTRFMGTFLSPAPLGRLLVNTIRRFR